MFQDLDATLQNLFKPPALPVGQPPLPKPPPPLAAADVSFLAPDRDFRSKVNNNGAVNLFLHRVRENTELRDSTPILEPGPNGVVRRPPPIRVDCSYLVTTWLNENTEKNVQIEHQLLGQALQWLSRFPTIPPGYLVGDLQTQEYPPVTMSAQLDSERVPVDFWTALAVAPRPSFDLTVTIAMAFGEPSFEGPEVISKELDIEFYTGRPVLLDSQGLLVGSDSVETLFSIGGTVTALAGGIPIKGASVFLVEPNLTAITDDQGHFLFHVPSAGTFDLRVSAKGFLPQVKTVDVPSTAAGAYNFAL